MRHLFSAHYENAHRRLLHDAGLDVLEPVVKPSELLLVHIHPRVRAEVDVARAVAGWLNVGEEVSHGPYDQALSRAAPEDSYCGL